MVLKPKFLKKNDITLSKRQRISEEKNGRNSATNRKVKNVSD